jgi:hypothetical protein
MMTAVGLSLGVSGWLPGAHVSAAALSAGVVAEAIVARWMARRVVRALLVETGPESDDAMSYRRMGVFYVPLALTSMLGLTIDPILTFMMGHSRQPVVSLAIYPVVDAFSFLFRALGLSFQEAAIALLGDRLEHRRAVARFALTLSVTASAGLALVAFTPVAHLWYGGAAGLAPDLVQFAIIPTMVLTLLPGFTVLQSWQRAVLVKARRTRPVTAATFVEVATLAATFVALDRSTGWIGVTVAVTAFVAGRVCGCLALAWPCSQVLKRGGESAS